MQSEKDVMKSDLAFKNRIWKWYLKFIPKGKIADSLKYENTIVLGGALCLEIFEDQFKRQKGRENIQTLEKLEINFLRLPPLCLNCIVYNNVDTSV